MPQCRILLIGCCAVPVEFHQREGFEKVVILTSRLAAWWMAVKVKIARGCGCLVKKFRRVKDSDAALR